MCVSRKELIVSFKRPVLCVLLRISLAVDLSLTADTIKGFVGLCRSEVLAQPGSWLGRPLSAAAVVPVTVCPDGPMMTL